MNTQFPLVSVLMTVYNREMYIGEAIESVLQSSYTNFELIVVDDCSKDNSVDIAKSYAEKDQRVRIIVNEKNLGDYPNRNKAASLAVGEWIMYVDSDDKMNVDGIEWCVRVMQQFPGALFGMYYDPSSKREPFYVDAKSAIQTHFYKEQFLSVGPGGTILNRDFFNRIGCYPEKYGPANDMYFNLKAAAATGVVFLPAAYFFYRIHDGQEQNNQFSYLYNNYKYTRDALNELPLGFTPAQIDYFRKKNNRRFVVNLYRHYRVTRDFSSVQTAWKLADFSWFKFFNGVFHF